MNWIESISEAIAYIEKNITQEITIEAIAKKALISPFYFQKGFTILCGFSVTEYIRNRRLALAGSELITSDEKIIDIALKYGYDSPDSFTKSFTRFHGATPTAVRKNGANIKSFAPLKIKFELEGGYTMDYRIVEKEEFTVVGLYGKFPYENAAAEVSSLWTKFMETPKADTITGTYGINIDESMNGQEFEYLIADSHTPTTEIPAGFITKTIPALTWAIFTCQGPLPQSMMDTNKKIFTDWLPNCRDYEIAAGYCIEMYGNPDAYPQKTQDPNYTTEMWIPVKRKL